MLIKEIKPNMLVDQLINNDYSNWTSEEAHELVDFYTELSNDTYEDVLVDPDVIGLTWFRLRDLKDARTCYDDITDMESLRSNMNVIECSKSLLVSEFE